MIVAVTGLVREARIVRGERVVTLVGGGDAGGLKKQLDTILPEKGVSGVISIGLAGGLSPDLRPGGIVIGSEVVSGTERYETDSDWLQRMWRAIPRSKPGIVAGSDTIIMHRPDKTALYERTGAVSVDMESHIAARAAHQFNKPFAVLRVVCDPGDRTLPPAALIAMKADGSVDIQAVLRSVAAHPRQIPDLFYLARASAAAFRTLLRCRNFLGDGLAGPDFR
jgi:hopanoid-associated phosphorylase